MSLSSDMATTARALLTDSRVQGQTVSFARLTSATFDPVLGSNSGGSTTTFTGKAAALNYNNAEIDGTVIQSGDVRLVMEATTTAPAQDDVCTVDSIDYRVMNVEPLSHAGTVIIYKIQLRK